MVRKRVAVWNWWEEEEEEEDRESRRAERRAFIVRLRRERSVMQFAVNV